MKSYEEYEKSARPGPAFSNGTQWETWQYSVCMGGGNDRRACVNDADDDCPLIMLGVLDEKTPAEWRTGAQPGCSEKTTAEEQRRAQRAAQEAADRAALEAQHYGPLFEVGGT
jgi:hypothetical protein